MDLFKEMICPYCEAENAKNARFCSKCGNPLRVVCPSCRQEQPVGAKFCSKCGTALNVENIPSEQDKKSRSWARRSGDFAQRFDILDLKGIFSKYLTVEQGERAIFLEGGVYKGALSAGVYNFGSVFSQFNINNRASLIIVDAGAVPLYFQISGLKTKNSITVSASGKVTAQIQNFLSFLENYLKHEGHISLADIENRLADELRYVTQNTVINYSAEELTGNTKVVAELEANFKAALNEGFGKSGIEILGVTCIGFDEGAWKQVMEERSKLSIEVGKAHAVFERRATLRDLENADAVDEIEGRGAVATARRSHETAAAIDEAEGKGAVETTKQEITHRLDDNELEHTLGKETRVFGHEQEKRKKEFEDDLYEISQFRKFQFEGTKQTLEMERENKRQTLEMERENKRQTLEIERENERRALENKRENERQILENRSNASVEALISILGGDNPAAKQIAKLELEKRAASLTSEQILAIQSVESPAVAEALKAKYSVEEQKEFNKRADEMNREYRENMKEVMNTTMKDVMTTALNAMGSTATARATAQNPGATVVAGGLGAPVVVNQQSGKKCPKCGTLLDANDLFCPECGEKQE